jgi:hypothetical protein
VLRLAARCCCVTCVLPPLQFKMLRDIEGQQFSDAVRDKLGPRVALMGKLYSCAVLRCVQQRLYSSDVWRLVWCGLDCVVSCQCS